MYTFSENILVNKGLFTPSVLRLRLPLTPMVDENAFYIKLYTNARCKQALSPFGGHCLKCVAIFNDVSCCLSNLHPHSPLVLHLLTTWSPDYCWLQHRSWDSL